MIFIGEKLGLISPEYQYSNDVIEYRDNEGNYYTSNASERFYEYLNSPVGASVIKQAMIERSISYWWGLRYRCGIINCEFGVGKERHCAEGRTEAEAVIAACLKVLEANEEKKNER